MIAECGCKTELERLLNEGKITFKEGLYKYVENVPTLKFGIFIDSKTCITELTIEDAVQYFITNYAAKFCSKKTNRKE